VIVALELPHVTAILRHAGLIDVRWASSAALDRGTAVHAATEYFDQDDLDRSSLNPEVAKRLAQYERFKEELRPEILSVEEVVVNTHHGYQGRLDRRVRINGREGVLDIKGPMVDKFHGPQLAAYAHCFDRPMARWTLHLWSIKWKLIEHKRPYDWRTFLEALKKWREDHP